VEFERGGVFTARLLEEDAPKTCRVFKESLPFEYRFWHSMVSGQAIVTIPRDINMVRENQRVLGIPPGTISFLVEDKPVRVPDEIYISYGVYFISRGSKLDIKQPVNVFAQIEHDLDKLTEIGKRILMEGAETVRFSLEE
jgi:hypothetical protein